ncbi:MAG: hypothetical protein IT379_25235 [Deltaproteobacteria bacterium]|nr:hypothetical protein [Deltaproteobacteria bacterium]
MARPHGGSGYRAHASPDWEVTFEGLAYLHEALAAFVDDEALHRLASRVATVLADGERIEHDRRLIWRSLVAAQAHVRLADAALDHQLSVFAHVVLEHVGGKRDHELYRRVFPEPHEDIIDLGLDAEVPVVTLVLTVLEEDESIVAAVRDRRELLRRALQTANRALAERADAYANLGRHRARVEAWLETAACTSRVVGRELERLAKDRRLGTRWLQAFVPAPPVSGPLLRAAPQPAPAPRADEPPA